VTATEAAPLSAKSQWFGAISLINRNAGIAIAAMQKTSATALAHTWFSIGSFNEQPTRMIKKPPKHSEPTKLAL